MQLQTLRQYLWAGCVALSLAFGMTGCGKDRAAETNVVNIYVPCGMEMPFMDLEEVFEAAHPGVDVRLLMDNAHILTERIVDKGERPDAVVSPGGQELVKLVEAGLVTPGAVEVFGQYDLCLFVPRANAGGVASIDDLRSDAVKTVAVADPDKTSIGHFTVQTLKKAGVWEDIQSKVVITGDASQTYKHVASEKAEASFAYRSCPLKTAPDKLEYAKVRVIQSVPAEYYGPAYASIALLNESQLARAFVDLILSSEGQAVFKSYDLPCLKDTEESP